MKKFKTRFLNLILANALAHWLRHLKQISLRGEKIAPDITPLTELGNAGMFRTGKDYYSKKLAARLARRRNVTVTSGPLEYIQNQPPAPELQLFKPPFDFDQGNSSDEEDDCTDPKLGLLVHDLMQNRLDELTAKRVRAHICVCKDCQQSAARIFFLRQTMDEVTNIEGLTSHTSVRT